MDTKLFLSFLSFYLLLALFTGSCDNPAPPPGPTEPQYSGTGMFPYNEYPPFADKGIKVYYHIPAEPTQGTPVVFLVHGGDRNAASYRNAWIEKANQYQCMVFAVEFSNAAFPGGDGFNLANIFVDGDNPSAATLNDESVWTFSVIEPLFEHIKTAMNNTSPRYYLYGHSAGAQFAHRMLLMLPEARLEAVVASAAGWYTVPDSTLDFPYGTRKSPAEQFDLSGLYAKRLIVMIGDQDNDPGAPGLRRNSIVDLQGTHRLARAQYFFQFGEQAANDLGASFRWQYVELPGIGHDHISTSKAAADLLFQ